MPRNRDQKSQFHQWVLESFPPGVPTVPKTRSHAGGRAGLLAKPEPAIKVTAPKCKEEMECDRTTMVRTSDEEATGKENQPPHPRRVRKRGRPNKSKPCFIP